MSTNRVEMGRREFLVLSSTALATVAVMPKLFAGESAAVVGEARLAVGFASFEERASAMDATRVSADGAFISRGALVGICGVRNISKNPRDRRAVEVLAHYSVADGAERKDIPLRAWAAGRSSEAQGKVAFFNMPVDETQKLVFSFATERGRPGGGAASRRDTFGEPTVSNTSTLTLSLTGEPGSIKLARGFYIVVPMFDRDSDPRWSSWRVGELDGRWSLVDGDNNPANFEHVILSIDYDSQS